MSKITIKGIEHTIKSEQLVYCHPTGEKKVIETWEIKDGKKKRRKVTRMVYPTPRKFTVIKI